MARYRVYYQYQCVPDYLPSRKQEIEANSLADAKEKAKHELEGKGKVIAWINAERIKSESEIEAESKRSTRWDRPDIMGGGTY